MDSTSLTITHKILNEEAEQTMIDIELLARKVYNASIVISSEVLIRWYHLNPSMWWIAKYHNCIIGYICAIPLKHDAFMKTLQVEFDELTDINDNDIRNWNDQSNDNYSLHICSIVVHPEYQKRSDFSIFRLLVENFFETILFYGKNGSIVQEWSGIAVSNAGRHILQHYFDLQFLINDNHNNSIFYGKTNNQHQQQLLQRIRTKLK
ncbi:unnamed protein product [Rotaria sp. Silwood1]|nr:unnamed protein product [Rotaria sp. Silwood1]CAF1583161.1 unnamed protein product [Rotaria sp. Silwood1]CAF3801601.1 unnamed protein product [Rotaria sp. Silwood1]CAF5140219.1 unnamed protein product [Rotaria sp. Silwood1]